MYLLDLKICQRLKDAGLDQPFEDGGYNGYSYYTKKERPVAIKGISPLIATPGLICRFDAITQSPMVVWLGKAGYRVKPEIYIPNTDDLLFALGDSFYKLVRDDDHLWIGLGKGKNRSHTGIDATAALAELFISSR